ncbi:D-ribose pyranase [Salinicoccus sesuvii]|uniref:D-ribose pyranase n=1 Tax=Salinicoccus sesuvii TaxID=868281 RepID=A0ABV7N6A2_9STAP
MYRSVVLNSEISKALSEMGHGDYIIIGDCGLPIPEGTKRIDIALKPGTPSFKETYELITASMYVEKKIYAKEATDAGLLSLLDDEVPSETVSHENFKVLLSNAKAVIRTGETTPYANVALYSNVFF